MEKMINYKDLLAMGFPQNQARRIIRLAKENLVKEGYGFYNGLVPTSAINRVLALPNKEGDHIDGKN